VLREAVVILLNGPSGVGKTTVGRLLAARAQSGACVHGDDLRNFVVSRSDEVELGLGYVNAATVAANFVRAGYERVVVDHVFEHPRHVTRFVDAFDVDADLHVVTLWASRDALAARGGSLEGHARMERALAELGDVVDTSGLSPEEVADAIEGAVVQA
jgi:ABC-type transporter Mla maintaining outer membrane lipid asymmetry ATPase subunit MlaF